MDLGEVDEIGTKKFGIGGASAIRRRARRIARMLLGQPSSRLCRLLHGRDILRHGLLLGQPSSMRSRGGSEGVKEVVRVWRGWRIK